MNWIRYKTLIIGGLISLLLIGVGIFLLVKIAGDAVDVNEALEAKDMVRSRLTSSTFYPSEENFKQLKENKAALEELLRSCRQEIQANQSNPIASMDPAGFGDYANREIRAIRRKAREAKTGGEAGVVLREPGFGLDSYLEGLPPNPRDVSRLTIQLIYMKHLAFLLFDQGISELISVKREVFEDQQASGAEMQDAREEASGFSFGGSRAGRKKAEKVIEEPSMRERMRELFEVEKFTVRFRAYEGSFLDVLNALAADKNQIVITKVEVTNGNRAIWPDYIEGSEDISSLQVERPARRAARSPRPGAAIANLFSDGADRPEGRGETVREASVSLVGLTEQRTKPSGGELLEALVEFSVYRLKAEGAAGEES